MALAAKFAGKSAVTNCNKAGWGARNVRRSNERDAQLSHSSCALVGCAERRSSVRIHRGGDREVPLFRQSVSARSTVSALPGLTGARFFAALAVVVWHYGLGSIAAVARWLTVPMAAAPVAVSFFYVLSGTVLTWGCTDANGVPTRPAPTFWLQLFPIQSDEMP